MNQEYAQATQAELNAWSDAALEAAWQANQDELNHQYEEKIRASYRAAGLHNIY